MALMADNHSMSPEDPEIEQFARERKNAFHAHEDAALPEAKVAFRRFVETEKDEIKRERMQEFIKFVDEAKSLEDVNWFREKAIKTAAASRSLADKAILDEQARQVRKKQVVNAWIFAAVLVVIIIGTGIGKTYYGVLKDGTEVQMDSEAPETIYVDKKPVTLQLHHHGYAFNQYVIARLIAAGIVIVVCVVFTVSKDI